MSNPVSFSNPVLYGFGKRKSQHRSQKIWFRGKVRQSALPGWIKQAKELKASSGRKSTFFPQSRSSLQKCLEENMKHLKQLFAYQS